MAKADQFTHQEIKVVKQNLIKKAQEEKISFFDIYTTIEDIADQKLRNQIMKDCLTEHKLAPCPPFAIINPSHRKRSLKQDQLMLGRNYDWGFANSFDPNNSDFTRLHKLVLKYIRKDLIETMDSKYKLYIE